VSKKKKQSGPERRRPMAEINLVSDPGKGSVGKRRGCLHPFWVLLLAACGVLLTVAAVH
jgi:hypothetical protein